MSHIYVYQTDECYQIYYKWSEIDLSQFYNNKALEESENGLVINVNINHRL